MTLHFSNMEKDMVEQSSTVPYSKSTYKEDLNPALGLTLLTPGLVPILFSYLFTNVRYPYTESQLLLTVRLIVLFSSYTL